MSFETERQATGFALHVGVSVLKVEEGYAKAELVLGPQHINPHGRIHGGCIFTLMDTAGGAAADYYGGTAITSSSHEVFLKAPKTQKLYAVARVAHAGRSLLVFEVEAEDENGAVVAKSTMTFFRLP